MRKKLWTIFPLLIGLVLLTAGSTFTVYGENDNTIDVALLYFWSKDGTLLGRIQCSDIFGTSYPWLEDMKVADDGSAMLLMTQKREDESASELMVFRLTGF